MHGVPPRSRPRRPAGGRGAAAHPARRAARRRDGGGVVGERPGEGAAGERHEVGVPVLRARPAPVPRPRAAGPHDDRLRRRLQRHRAHLGHLAGPVVRARTRRAAAVRLGRLGAGRHGSLPRHHAVDGAGGCEPVVAGEGRLRRVRRAHPRARPQPRALRHGWQRHPAGARGQRDLAVRLDGHHGGPAPRLAALLAALRQGAEVGAGVAVPARLDGAGRCRRAARVDLPGRRGGRRRGRRRLRLGLGLGRTPAARALDAPVALGHRARRGRAPGRPAPQAARHRRVGAGAEAAARGRRRRPGVRPRAVAGRGRARHALPEPTSTRTSATPCRSTTRRAPVPSGPRWPAPRPPGPGPATDPRVRPSRGAP
nr:hypothetical protein [Angustibacter aerolatus]